MDKNEIIKRVEEIRESVRFNSAHRSREDWARQLDDAEILIIKLLRDLQK